MAEIREITPLFLTTQGLRLQAKVQTGVTQLIVTRVLIGSGYLDDETDKELLTAPIAEISSHTSRDEGTDVQVDVTRLFYDEGDGVAMISIHVESGDNESTHLREICIMAQDLDDGEIMYGYTNLGDAALPLPKYDNRSCAVYDINIPTVIANANDVVVNITKLVEVSTEEFDAHKTAPVIDHPDGSVTKEKLERNVRNSLFEIFTETGNPVPETFTGIHFALVPGKSIKHTQDSRPCLLITHDHWDTGDGDSGIDAYLFDLITGEFYWYNEDSQITVDNIEWTKIESWPPHK